MSLIRVIKKFKFRHKDGTRQEFPIGRHDVAPEVAEHVFVKAHCGDPDAFDKIDDATEAQYTELLAEAGRETAAALASVAELSNALETANAQIDALKQVNDVAVEEALELQAKVAELQAKVDAAEMADAQRIADAETAAATTGKKK